MDPHSPGVLRATAADLEMRITKGRLYIGGRSGEPTDEGALLEQWPLTSIVSVTRRRHELRHMALELTIGAQQDARPEAQGSVLLDFSSHDDRERTVQTLLSQQPHLQPPDDRSQEVAEQWHRGEVDNYAYLLYLNECASRSFRDLSQYPIMPWVLSDYSSAELDLSDPQSFRPLCKPVGALDERRLSAAHMRRRELQLDAAEGEMEPLYHTHYSSPAYVAFYLLRVAPSSPSTSRAADLTKPRALSARWTRLGRTSPSARPGT